MTATPFVGREPELAAVRGVLERSRAGSGSAIVIRGPGGIGKSRLVAEAVAATDGLTVLHVSCGELERDMPFAAIATALDLRRSSTDPQAAALAALIGDPGGEDLRFRVVDEIIDLLERRALAAPVVVVLDDVHRADPGTLLVAKRLARVGSVLPVALVCTRRPHPTRPDVDDALVGAQRMELDALSADEASALASAVLGAPPSSSLATAIQRAGGNPLYATELVRSLETDHRIERVGGFATLVEGDLPTSLRLTILAQLAFLDDDAARVLRVASCFGTSFDARDACEALGRTVADLLDALEPTMAAGILVPRGERLSFRHDLVREAIYDDMPEPIRVGLHSDIARALTAADRPVTELAPHVLRSARSGDVASVELLRRAASAALPLSATTAVELLSHARTIAPSRYGERHELALDLATALSTTGRQADAESLGREVLGSHVAPDLAQRARGVVVQAARARDATSGVVDILDDLETREPRDARLLALAARSWSQLGDWSRAEALAPEALRLAEAAGDDEARCLSLWASAWAAAHGGRMEEVVANLAAAFEVIRGGAVEPGTRADFAWGHLQVFGGFKSLRVEARDMVIAELRQAEAAGHLWVLPLLQGALASDHVRWRELDDAVVAATAAIRVAEDIGGARFLSNAHSTLARAATYLGDLESAARHLAAAEASAAHEDDPLVGALNAAQATAIYEDARGRPEAVATALWDVFQRYGSSTMAMVLNAGFWPRLARCLMHVGRTADARELLAAVELFEQTTKLWDQHNAAYRLFTLHVRFIVDREPAVARAALEMRKAQAESRSWGLLEDAAEVLDEHDSRDEAIALLSEALAGWEEARAPLDIARVTARLRELGVRHGVTGTRGRPTTGWDALTEAELRVADLVADGLTYREIGERLFLSRRTVESHVARIFTKLDLSSRRDLAVEVIRRREP